MISVSGGGKRDEATAEHRCGRCWGPYGKSTIPCPNEPAPKDLTPLTTIHRYHPITDDELERLARAERRTA